MHICVVGTGYVGLVTGACLADFGINVTCVDKDERKIDMLLRGEMPIYEPGLDSLVEKNAKAGRLHFTTDLDPAIRSALAIFIAVGTPPKEDGSADLSYVIQVAESIADNLDGYKVIITKSTVPTGTGQLIEKTISERTTSKHPFSVVSNPEFLREGSAIEDFMRPDRVVIGARDDQAIAIMKDIYSPLFLRDTPFVITNVESSELIKYASNAFLATKITFINEVAELCELIGADVHHVAKGMGLDNRIGPKFLHPGPGYGGSCFPKDTQALTEIARKAGRPFDIVESVVAVNERMKVRAVDKVRAALDNDLAGQDRRPARPLVQTRDRRYAGVCFDPHRRHAGQRGRQGARLRPGRHGQRQDHPPRVGGVLRRLLRRRHRRRRPGHRHRVEPVPLPRYGSDQISVSKATSSSICATSAAPNAWRRTGSSTTVSAGRKSICR